MQSTFDLNYGLNFENGSLGRLRCGGHWDGLCQDRPWRDLEWGVVMLRWEVGARRRGEYGDGEVCDRKSAELHPSLQVESLGHLPSAGTVNPALVCLWCPSFGLASRALFSRREH